jgi:hypothetical protein
MTLGFMGETMSTNSRSSRKPAPGLPRKPARFLLLLTVNAFAGAMVAMERSILPASAEQEFKRTAQAAFLSFIVVPGVSEAITDRRISC